MKTPKFVASAIEKHSRAVYHTAEMIRVKTTVPYENQASHIKEGFPQLWIARLEGQAIMLESMMHDANVYGGFYYVDAATIIEGVKPQQIGMDDPAYKDWSRRYVSKRQD